MDLALFHPLAEATGPFASITIDVTKTDPANTDHLNSRWRELERRLRECGTPDDVLDTLREAALEPTGKGGQHGRVVVANADRVLLAHDLPGRPVDDATWGPIPSLLPAIRALSSAVPHIVVRVDRTGADIEVHAGPDGQDAQTVTVQGDHDDLRQVKTGGTAQRRFESRIQDSWEHNAAAVAEELDRIVRTARPKVVIVMGEEHTVSFLEQHASAELRAVMFRSHAGGRAEGSSEEVVREVAESSLAATRAEAEAEIVGRFEEQTGRAEAASEGLVPVVDVLQRAQVAELLLVEGREHDQELWVGEDALQLGITREDVEALGATEPVLAPADDALVWAAVCSRAGVTLLDTGQANPADGVGALLRWSDESTPRARFPSMPGHGGT